MQYFGFDRPSFGIKTYGFGESSPKLQADFTTGTYKADGAAKTFADLFTFTRAGKAWLVKDTGLQEYAADVPRLDNGLLIEQSATNIAVSRGAVRCTWVGNDVVLISDGTANQTGYFAMSVSLVEDEYTTTTIYIKSEKEALEKLSIGDAGIFSYTVNVKDATYVKTADHSLIVDPSLKTEFGNLGTRVAYTRKSSQNLVTSMRYNIPSAAYSIIGSNLAATARYTQHEVGKVDSSYILVDRTPVTRPADFLINNITGTTVTGDWDSTLNLSIVAGKLVHSGYGRIRSLEIN